MRIIRLKNGGRVKHAVDKDLEKKLSKPFFFVQHVNGSITQVFFPHNDKPELIGLKKGRLKYSIKFIGRVNRKHFSLKLEIYSILSQSWAIYIILINYNRPDSRVLLFLSHDEIIPSTMSVNS